MTTIPKLIRVLLSFSQMLPEQLLAFGYNILESLTGNSNFTTLPVDLNVLKTGLDNYAVAIGDAKDGSRKAIVSRNQQGENIIRMLRSLATYVELNCKDDMNIFLSSGFQPRSNVRTPAQPLALPTIESLDQGATQELLAWINAVRRAKNYELRIGAVGPGGATPTTWSVEAVPNARSAVSLSGLTPCTTYAVQVRAYGALGYTPWSDSVVCASSLADDTGRFT